MKKIVLTGGPCGGKSTTLRALEKAFPEQIIFVPEVATILLKGGFPVPGRDVKWSQAWQSAFQSAILPLQKSLEDAFVLIAKENGKKLLICDRGVLDGAAYTPGGHITFCQTYNIKGEEAIARYSAVIHLESLATANPEKYGKTGNENRFEPLERAQELEFATRQAWEMHKNHSIINGQHGIEKTISAVIEIVRAMLNG
jgi:thymidylate kinase